MSINTASGADKNCAVIGKFQSSFMRDLEGFRSLWVESPVIRIPFAPPGMKTLFEGASGFDEFWLPIFGMEGRFDWTTERLIVGDDPSTIVVTARSDVDVSAAGNPIKYAGKYIQVFDFIDGKISSFTEYIDSFAMGKTYKLI